MKYLKLFENHGNTELTIDQYYDILGDSLEIVSPENFTKEELNKISKVVNEINPKITINKKPFKLTTSIIIQLNCEYVVGSTYPAKQYVKKYNDDSGFDMEIIKDSDEWYYINMEKFKWKGLTSQRLKILDIYYKCDQLDGLVEQLKELIK